MKFKNAENIEYQIVWRKPYTKKKNKYNIIGLCDDPTAKKPKIWISPHLNDKQLCRVMIEEICHAYMFDKNEKTVRRFSSNLRRMIWKVFKVKKRQQAIDL